MVTPTSTSSTVSEQIEALSHVWDDYLYCPCEIRPWPSLARTDLVSTHLLYISKIVLINVLPAAIPLQVLIWLDAVTWINLTLNALLVLEIGPCRILTRLVDRVAPYPREIVFEVLPETTASLRLALHPRQSTGRLI